MEFINTLKARLPDYAKDIRLNLDAVIARSSLTPQQAAGAALAAAFAAKSAADRRRHPQRRDARRPRTGRRALTAAALMGMNNVWYPFVEMADDADLATMRPELRMNAYATHGGVDRPELRAVRAGRVDRRQVRVLRAVALQAAEGDRPHHAAAARRRPHRGGDQRRGAGARRRSGGGRRRVAARTAARRSARRRRSRRRAPSARSARS